ncbi:MAG TPA: BrxA/BrxB family bacilliredoxin [Bacteroidia bacterium]|jgi:putative YphP/YqiW family bacilliredoxin|nr:BrxA/BrxB family bacilliredoxin [Bacteroidia bacterium]
MYPPELVRPMREELSSKGFQELHTADEVDAMMHDSQGTVLVMVNSVCGCAAGAARPGIVKAVSTSAKLPKHLTTVFAGVDREATDKARAYMAPYPPSSPAIALFKDGNLVHMIERRHIEGRSADMIAGNLLAAFEEHC